MFCGSILILREGFCFGRSNYTRYLGVLAWDSGRRTLTLMIQYTAGALQFIVIAGWGWGLAFTCTFNFPIFISLHFLCISLH